MRVYNSIDFDKVFKKLQWTSIRRGVAQKGNLKVEGSSFPHRIGMGLKVYNSYRVYMYFDHYENGKFKKRYNRDYRFTYLTIGQLRRMENELTKYYNILYPCMAI